MRKKVAVMALMSPPPVDDWAALDGLIEHQERLFAGRVTRSIELRTEAGEVLPGGVTSNWQDAPPQAVWLSHGAGSHVVDVDGNDYVDMHAGFGALLCGHGHPAIVAALREQVERGTHFAQPTPILIEVARELRRRFDLPKWRFCNSGTEATMEAIHLMRAVTGRSRIIKVEGSYHGHHDHTQVSVYPDAGHTGPPWRPLTVREHGGIPLEVARLVKVVPFGDLDAVERALMEYPDEIAGMIVEPIMMNIGIITPPVGYLVELRSLLHRHGAYLCFDEVKTGLTVAPGGATELLGATADVVCLAKAMGGGLPCGAIGGTDELFDRIADGTYEQVGTFNGNPLTMAASRAMLTEVLTPEAYRRFEAQRCTIIDGIESTLRRHGLPGYVRAFGAKGCVVFHDEELRNYRDFLAYDGRFGHAHWLFQHNGGVFLPPWGKMEQFTLSVQHSDADITRFLANTAAFAAALDDADHQLARKR
jgi:glutamate-1-semialdehyde 2,1-aminomutase